MERSFLLKRSNPAPPATIVSSEGALHPQPSHPVILTLSLPKAKEPLFLHRPYTDLQACPQTDLSPAAFTTRAAPHTLPEQMDGQMDDPISLATLRRCLGTLRQINRVTGSYRPTLAFLARAVRHATRARHHLL